MSAQNPFQIPSCFKLDIEQRRRERFKKTVVTAVIVSVAVVVGLLIEGCVSEKSASVTPIPPANPVTAPAQTTTATPALPQPNEPAQARPKTSISQTSSPLQPCPVAMVPKTASPVITPQKTGGAVYLVKSGDTLSHIAKTHGTTVKALKTANNLTDDRISVGEQLKIPTA
jgi:LysM repeat protein